MVLVAVGGAIAYTLASPARAARPPDQLPTRVQTVQTVGLIGQVRAGQAGLRQLNATGTGLQFGPLPGSAQSQGDPEWTADTIVGGTYVFIYAPIGRCLTAAGPAARPVLALGRCDLSPAQRWARVAGSAVQSGGHEYDQYRNLGSGRCLSTDPAASPARPPGVLTQCLGIAPATQLLSFWWSA